MHGLDNNYNLKGWKVELKPVKEGNEVSDKVDFFQLISRSLPQNRRSRSTHGPTPTQMTLNKKRDTQQNRNVSCTKQTHKVVKQILALRFRQGNFSSRDRNKINFEKRSSHSSMLRVHSFNNQRENINSIFRMFLEGP